VTIDAHKMDFQGDSVDVAYYSETNEETNEVSYCKQIAHQHSYKKLARVGGVVTPLKFASSLVTMQKLVVK